MMKYLWLWKGLGITGLLGLILLITIWNGWLTPYQQIPRSIELVLLLTPLMFLVRGMLRGNAKTNVYGILWSLFYASLGVWYITSEMEQGYGIGLTAFSVLMYIGSFLTARTLGQFYKKQQAEAEQSEEA